MTLMEQKTHEIKFLELQIKSINSKIIGDFAALPPDLVMAKKRLFELQQNVKALKQGKEGPTEQIVQQQQSQ